MTDDLYLTPNPDAVKGEPVHSTRRPPTFLLAVCGKCSEPFVPADETDLEHVVRDDGLECGGMGWHADPSAPYKRLDPQPDCTELGPFVIIEESVEGTERTTQHDTLGPALSDALRSNATRLTTDYPRYYVERVG